MAGGAGENGMATRQQLASLAHAKAHEVIALRDLAHAIAGHTTVEQVHATLGRMIDARRGQAVLLGCEAHGHA